ncbi:MAG: Eco57I restriction-modification methylase domain-containing protein [Proteobacteria bacterium]|nr:Eco57I restriction-modification methylase domain-containing protein [Pseudomonadota bacterium]
MPIEIDRARNCLKSCDFKLLLIEELGWDHYSTQLEISVDGQNYVLEAVAEKKGMVIFLCLNPDDKNIPTYPVRRKIERQVARSVHEHIIIYLDDNRTTQIWQWVKRELGKPTACREHTFHVNQPGDSLIQKLQTLAFSLEEEENLTIVDVAGRTRSAFDVEKVTKKFYDRFKTEHDAFLKFIEGIPDEEMLRWYTSVMLNRLMFIYFIQKKGFLDSDDNYLRNKLVQSKEKSKDCFYKAFLCPLFFEGFAKKEDERSEEMNHLLGKIPYLNGGLFLKHQIEELYGEQIEITDNAFEKLFDFFDQYQWYLDERPLRADNEINPDVLGYIFEKYINQKQMGAYYTKEDITEYISKNTVIPFLFDAARQKCNIAFEGEQSVWKLLQSDPDRYIYKAVRKGVNLPLPEEIAVGLNDVSKRTEWNKSAPEEYALPTEIWREVVARRKWYEKVKAKAIADEITSINDFITYNLNIRQFAQDVIENCEGPELLRAFWHAIVGKIPEKSNEKFENGITVLDPTCGSGAFLFAALNVLEPLYEACLDRMEVFLDDLGRSGEKRRSDKYGDFKKILKRIDNHPNRRYFILKSIIINNLFGVDIMEEAVEICKLRLFLKLVAQVDEAEKIEPLPDIDFNIRAGNTLVGFATYEDVEKTVTSRLGTANTMAKIRKNAQELDELFNLFRQMQTEQGMDSHDYSDAKEEVNKRLKILEDELNLYLAGEYGVDAREKTHYEAWRSLYKPFHWLVEFYGILKDGGFDVIIGNPPYVEYVKVRKAYSVKGYVTEASSNLYAFVTERSLTLMNRAGGFGFIVPISIGCTQRMKSVQDYIGSMTHNAWFSNYAERPSKLFVGAEVLLSIIIARGSGLIGERNQFTTGFTKWTTDERPVLFDRITYCQFTNKPKLYVVPKLAVLTEIAILRKLVSRSGSLSLSLHNRSNHTVFYRIGGGRYWKIFTNFQPRFVLNGELGVSSRENYLYFASETIRDAAISVLSSSLFYWYFIQTTNCRDLNPSDLQEFPINLGSISKDNLSALVELCGKLMKDYSEKSAMKEKTSSLTGNIIYQEFYPRHSKPLIDEIDRVLARHYGFTDEELDFIINYDIKYRMGLGSQEDE